MMRTVEIHHDGPFPFCHVLLPRKIPKTLRIDHRDPEKDQVSSYGHVVSTAVYSV